MAGNFSAATNTINHADQRQRHITTKKKTTPSRYHAWYHAWYQASQSGRSARQRAPHREERSCGNVLKAFGIVSARRYNRVVRVSSIMLNGHLNFLTSLERLDQGREVRKLLGPQFALERRVTESFGRHLLVHDSATAALRRLTDQILPTTAWAEGLSQGIAPFVHTRPKWQPDAGYGAFANAVGKFGQVALLRDHLPLDQPGRRIVQPARVSFGATAGAHAHLVTPQRSEDYEWDEGDDERGEVENVLEAGDGRNDWVSAMVARIYQDHGEQHIEVHELLTMIATDVGELRRDAKAVRGMLEPMFLAFASDAIKAGNPDTVQELADISKGDPAALIRLVRRFLVGR